MKPATKNEVDAYVRSLGGLTAYSGKTRTMYVSYSTKAIPPLRYIIDQVKNEFWNIPFTLKTNNDATQTV